MTTGNEIAIIGLAGRFPGAPDVRTFWRNLRDGVESISFFGADELQSSAMVPERMRDHDDFVSAGGVLRDAERFDHDLFGMSPREARMLDPQLRVFLETAWTALEDAGYDPAGYPGRISVYAGAGTSGHLHSVLQEVSRDPVADPAALYEAMSAATADNLATRVSFALGLRGESVTVHTACSTGLAAVHLGAQSLLLGQSGMALAGAVRLMLPQRTGYVYSDGMILSPDGHCRAFDHRAAGTVSGNGVGVVVLKPLAAALDDGDSIYAVLEGSAMNNDGHRGVGYTAPSVAGQADVITEALAFAEVAGHQIGYVEAHGTGTPLGDPIEIAALTRAYRQSSGPSPGTRDCAIGSVKTNIGHLDTAAGIAGLIKVALMLRHQEIPPSLHLQEPNPSIDFADGPFFVNSELREWKGNGQPRRAGVSSFGIGGTNVHAVLAEAPAVRPRGGSESEHHLVTLSAHTPSALAAMANDLADRLRDEPAPLADVAYTRAVGRASLRCRRAVVAGDVPELIAGLRTVAADAGGSEFAGVAEPSGSGRTRHEPRVALLFPGNGSAWHGMAGELHRVEPAFRTELDACLAELEPRLGRPLAPTLLTGTGPIEDAELAHAGIFAVEYALARMWSSWGVRPDAVLGHSFGEYVAACVAGVLSLPDAAELAVTRGRLVAGLPEGGMLAVGLREEALLPYLEGTEVSLAAVNGDGRCVVSGPLEELARLRRLLDEAGHPSVSLPVRYAFHSPVVEPVMADLRAAAGRCVRNSPTLPLLSGLTGTWWAAEDGEPAYWARQLREPVRFGDALDTLVGSPTDDQRDSGWVLIEAGADQALTTLARAQAGGGAGRDAGGAGDGRVRALPSLRRRSGDARTDQQVLSESLGVAWCSGVRVDWSAFHQGKRGRRIGLPTYPFEGNRFDVAPVGPQGTPIENPAPDAVAETPATPGTDDGPAASEASGDASTVGEDVERMVFEIWRERLGRDDFGYHDDFLALGGNSLMAAQLLTRLREAFGVPLPLAALFEAPTVAGLAERIRALGTEEPVAGTGTSGHATGAVAADGSPPIPVVPRDRELPLSITQDRTLAIEASDPGNPALVMPVAVLIEGELDLAALERALEAVVRRHETLRTTFDRDQADGRWTQRVQTEIAIRIEPEVLTGTAAERERAARALARTEPAEPFDLATSPLRVRLLRLDAQRHVLLVTVHHVVSDTWSMATLIGELAAVYRSLVRGGGVGPEEPGERDGDADGASLPPLDRQYVDFAGWQRDRLDSGELAGQQAYWRRQLAGMPEPLRLLGDVGPDQGFRGSRVPAALSGDLADQLRAVGQRLGSTSFVTLLAAYAVLLGRLAGRDDLVVGTPIGNRDRAELEGMVGYVAHALPLRIDLGGDPSFADLVARLRRTLLSAYANQDVPYESLVAEVDPAREGGRMFDALLVVHSGLASRQQVPGAEWTQLDVPDMPAMFGPTMSRLSLMLVESPDGFDGAMEYAQELYEPAAVSRLFEQFVAVLTDAVARPEARIRTLGADAGLPEPVRSAEGRSTPIRTTAREAPPAPPSPGAQPGVRLSLSYFANDEDALVGPKYQLLLEGAKLADALGFEAIWTPERHFHPFGGLYPSPTAVNAGLATVTERIGLRAGSVVLPLHDAIRVAEEWSVIDNLSGGRAGVSFASGWNVDDFVLAPDRYADRKRVMAEQIEVVRRLWRGEPVSRRNGNGDLVDIRIRPRPVQAELPFWLTAAGSPATFRLAGELGGFVLTNLMGQSLESLAEKLEVYRTAWRAAGHRSPADGHVTLMLHAFLADETERAYAEARGPLLDYFRSSVDIMRGMIASQGVQARPEDLSEEDLSTLLEHGLSRYLNEGGLFGTAADCVPMLNRVGELGVNEVAALIDFGAPVDTTLHSVELLGELIEPRTAPGIAPTTEPVERTLPLSYAQRRLWYLDQLEPRNIAYNNPVALRMRGRLDVDALSSALRTVVRRHEILRTTFRTTDDGPVQVIAESVEIELPVTDAEPADIDRLARAHAREPFDLEQGPLLRARLLRSTVEGETEHVLLVSMHHIVSDGWSAGVLFTELATLYTAELAGLGAADAPLPPLRVQYADYAIRQREQADSAPIRDEIDYWKRQLAAVPMLDLPIDRPRGALQSYAGARSPVRIDRPLTDGIGELCRRFGVTPYMVLHAGLATLLHRYSEQTDLAIGTAVAGRNHPEYEQLVGCFVNSVVVRTDVSGDPAFGELLDRVKGATLGALAHAEVPFERLVDELDVPRSLGHSPLFQAMLVLHNTPDPRIELGELTLESLEVDPGFAKLDLMLELREGPDGIAGSWEYNTDLFDAATIEQLTRHLVRLLSWAVADPEQPVSELDLVSDTERGELLALSRGEPLVVPADEPLGQRSTIGDGDSDGGGGNGDVVPVIFQRQAARTPDACAVGAYGTGQASLTYRELDEHSNRIAHGLRARGVRPGRLVALLVDDPALAITAMLGVLKAGGGYVPLDPRSPRARLRTLLDQTEPALVLTDGEPSPDIEGHESSTLARIRADQPATPPPSEAAPDDPAYVIFTSGSTGQPKGVVVEHRQLVYSTRTRRARYGPAETSLDLYAMTFDVSVGLIHHALLTGGTVISPPREVVTDPVAVTDLIHRHGVTRLGCIPGLYAQLLAAADPHLLGSLRVVTVAGEPVSAELIRAHTEALPDVELHNEYGPTEATVFCTAHRVDTHRAGRVPIGRPLPGGVGYVLDRRRRPLPVGAQGELYVGGPGVARGYLAAPELTRERFVPDPTASGPESATDPSAVPARLYRTGDRVRWNRQGVLEFLGRIDRQVKVRGFRVEPGEVESVLTAHPAVTEAAVVPVEDIGHTRLVGYVAYGSGNEPTDPGDLLEFAREHLPDYLVPAALVPVPALPRTANGKLDAAALPAVRPSEHASASSPRSELERNLAEVFSEVLGRSTVGVRDNFFALGGDSILVISAVTRARRRGIALEVRQLFQHPTVAGLASVLSEPSDAPEARPTERTSGQASGQALEQNSEQGTVSGPVPLTPIQRWFFGLGLAEPWHWNMAVQLEFTEPIRAELLQEAFRAVFRQHDALRLRFDQDGRDGDVPTARNAAAEVDWKLDRLELPSTAESPSTEVADRLQASCDLSAGPLLRAVLIRRGEGLPDRLVVIAHHLVIDGVSWRILLEDVFTAYRGMVQDVPVELPAKTTSYAEWARRLAEFADAFPETEEGRAELEYWTSVPYEQAPRLPRDGTAGDGTAGDGTAGERGSETLRRELDVERTRLLEELAQATGTRLHDILLTVVVRALGAWAGAERVLLDVEKHGREDLLPGLDLTRTVGWFSDFHPVVLPALPDSGPVNRLFAVRDRLAEVPRNGAGYVPLRFGGSAGPAGTAGTALDDLPQSEVTFNYLGQLDLALPPGAPARIVGDIPGRLRAGSGPRPYLVDITAGILDGRLWFAWDYDAGALRKRTIEALAEATLDAVQELSRP